MFLSPIPFEIHLTTDPLTSERQGAFVGFCASNGAKALLIELSKGQVTSQPMLSKVGWFGEVEPVFDHIKTLSAALAAANFSVRRIKVEVPAVYAPLLTDYQTNSAKYFEWHGKIAYTRTALLREISNRHHAHLSRNALKNEPDYRFITLREPGHQDTFTQRLTHLTSDLASNGWQLAKQQAEYCFYDNNHLLDAGWLDE